MKDFLKIILGFVLGVIITLGSLFVIGQCSNNSIQQRRAELKKKNYRRFELSTKSGIVKLHTYMSKDSVQILMGRPRTTNVNDLGIAGVNETWEYRGRNKNTDEFTLEFTDGELESVEQYRE